MPVDEVGEQVAAWLHAALYDAEGRQNMKDREVIRRAEIAPGTFYNLINGKGGGADNETLARVARALGVSAPRIVPHLHWTVSSASRHALGPCARNTGPYRAAGQPAGMGRGP